MARHRRPINSGVACFYYLKLLGSVYAKPEAEPPIPGQDAPSLTRTAAVSVPAGIALALAAASVLMLGIFPGRVLHLADYASSSLRANSAPCPKPAASAQATSPSNSK